jgi:hypothetical protein
VPEQGSRTSVRIKQVLSLQESGISRIDNVQYRV